MDAQDTWAKINERNFPVEELYPSSIVKKLKKAGFGDRKVRFQQFPSTESAVIAQVASQFLLRASEELAVYEANAVENTYGEVIQWAFERPLFDELFVVVPLVFRNPHLPAALLEAGAKWYEKQTNFRPLLAFQTQLIKNPSLTTETLDRWARYPITKQGGYLPLVTAAAYHPNTSVETFLFIADHHPSLRNDVLKNPDCPQKIRAMISTMR